MKITEIKKIKKYALSNGITTIDTAQAYGEGENVSTRLELMNLPLCRNYRLQNPIKK